MSVEHNCNPDCEFFWHTPGTMYLKNGDPGDPPDEGCDIDYDEKLCPYVTFKCDICDEEIQDFSECIDDEHLGLVHIECIEDVADDEMFTFIKPCVQCKTWKNIKVSKHKYYLWKYKGQLIQNAMPDLPIDSREFLISNLCEKCFPSEEE